MPDLNHRVLLESRPDGLVQEGDFSHDAQPIPEPGEGEVLVRVEWLGIDATVRTWLSKAEGYIEPVEIGDVVRGSGIGRVIASRSAKIAEGQLVATLTGWQEYAVVGDDPMLTTPLAEGVDPQAALGVFGANGLTAYVGLTEVGKVKEGETVVVSAAAGATGSIAVQIAKILGCRVIGIAGTDEKCAWLVDELGLDGAINHRTDDVPSKLRELCPKRVDVFFDNTGGPILDAVLGRLADRARVVLCGAISSYNDHHKPPGPAELPQPHLPAGSHGGLHLMGPLGTLGGDNRDARGVGGRRSPAAPEPRLRGPRVGAPGLERHVHRREHRQDRDPRRRLSVLGRSTALVVQ